MSRIISALRLTEKFEYCSEIAGDHWSPLNKICLFHTLGRILSDSTSFVVKMHKTNTIVLCIHTNFKKPIDKQLIMFYNISRT